MNPVPPFTLPADFLSSVFPFHLVLDEDGVIVQAGKALAQIEDCLEGRPLGDAFELTDATETPIPLSAAERNGELVLFLESRKHALRLRGQLISTPRRTRTFFGIPWVTDITDLKRAGLSLQDFPTHVPIAEYLMLLQGRDTALEDARLAARRLRSQGQELRVAKENAERAEERLASYFDAANDAILVARVPDYDIVDFNPAAERVFGMTREAALKTSARCLFLDDIRSLIECSGSESRSYSFDIAGRRGETTFPAEVSYSSIRRDREEICMLIVRDQSEKIGLEMALRNAQKMESIGQLAAGIAHEINTPTQYVSDNAQFLRTSFAELLPLLIAVESMEQDTDPDELRRMLIELSRELDLGFLCQEIPQALEHSLDGIGRITSIVRAMKEFSHPGDESKQPTDLNELLSTAATVTRNEWKYVAHIDFDLDATLMPFECYAGELSQVFLNILVNAGQAIADDPERGHGLSSIRVATRRLAGAVEVRIEDDGPGIPEEHRERIFEPFFTTKEMGRGTGQGLSIAQRIVVERHGGTLRVDSAPGEGTRFVIRLPYPAEDGELTGERPGERSGAEPTHGDGALST